MRQKLILLVLFILAGILFQSLIKPIRKPVHLGGLDLDYRAAEMHEWGKGVPQNDEEAVKRYIKLAEIDNWRTPPNELPGSGVAAITRALKRLIEKKISAVDPETGCEGTIKWIRKLNEMGDTDGARKLGSIYETNNCVKPDFAKAAQLYYKSFAYSDLARLYATGGSNMPQNYSEAYFWCGGSHFKDMSSHSSGAGLPAKWEVRPKDYREPKCNQYAEHLDEEQIIAVIKRLDDWASKVDELEDFKAQQKWYTPPLEIQDVTIK